MAVTIQIPSQRKKKEMMEKERRKLINSAAGVLHLGILFN